MNIGFIGLGIMGKPMAKNLLRAGHPLFVYNRSTQSVQELAAAGAAASSIAQICAQCSVIFTMLPDSPDVRSVVLEQLYPHLKGGQVLIDMSSIDPGVSREIGEKLAEKQVGMLDAPVSGGEPKAVDATLSFMVGGQDALFRQYAPLLKTMGRTVTYCGPLGAGNTVKLANQMIVAANIAAASEGLMLARRNGVSPETVFHAVRGGLAGSAVMEAKVPMMLRNDTQPGFRIRLHIKDLKNALRAAEDSSSPAPLSSVVMQQLLAVQEAGFSEADHSAIAKYYEALTGETLYEPNL